MQLLNMGGYEIYVWSAYSITLIVFAINVIAIFLEKRRVKKMIQKYLAQVSD